MTPDTRVGGLGVEREGGSVRGDREDKVWRECVEALKKGY